MRKARKISNQWSKQNYCPEEKMQSNNLTATELSNKIYYVMLICKNLNHKK